MPTKRTSKFDGSFLIREPEDVYHAKSKEYLTAHGLNDFRRCPLLYHKKQTALISDEDSAAYLIGRALHTLVLEGREEYERSYAIGGPINPKTGQPFGETTKAFAEWEALQAKPVLSTKQAALVTMMQMALQEHAIACTLFAEGIPERVVRCRYGGFDCQARIDWIATAGLATLVDLKTTEDLDSFEYAIRMLGYVHQMAFYRGLISVCTRQRLPVCIIAVEKREPYRVGVWAIEDSVLNEADAQNREAMEELQRCRATGNWFTRFEGLRTIHSL